MVEVFYKIVKNNDTKQRVYYKRYKNGTTKIITKEMYNAVKKTKTKTKTKEVGGLLFGKKQGPLRDIVDITLVFSKIRQLQYDTTQPLSNYYIFSSHNTYCTSRQSVLTNPPEVAVEPYKYLLERFKGGCLEIDTVDPGYYIDETGTIVHDLQVWHALPGLHIPGLAGSASPIYFRDIMKIIIEYALANQPGKDIHGVKHIGCYPIILSIDMKNKSYEALETLSNVCKELFTTNRDVYGLLMYKRRKVDETGTEMFINSPIDPYDESCTLNAVMGKILFKNGSWDPSEVKQLKSLWLNQYVAFPKGNNMKSLVECKTSLSKLPLYVPLPPATPATPAKLPIYIRIYPNAFELNSNNFDPLPYWIQNAQMVALNMQTNDIFANMNTLLFYNTPFVIINNHNKEIIKSVYAIIMTLLKSDSRFFENYSFLTSIQRCSSTASSDTPSKWSIFSKTLKRVFLKAPLGCNTGTFCEFEPVCYKDKTITSKNFFPLKFTIQPLSPLRVAKGEDED